MYRTIATCLLCSWAFCVGVLHATWSPPVNVSALNEIDLFPEIAVNSNGDATAVWINQTRDVIQASSKRFDGSWQTEEDLSQLPIISHTWEYARVAMDDYGNATAVWMGYDTTVSNNIIQVATKPFGEPWQPPHTVSLTSLNAIGSIAPQIAVDSHGNATVVWVSVIGADYIVQAAFKPFGGTWQEPVNVSRPGSVAYFTSIAVNRNGDLAVAWVGVQGSDEFIQAATKPFGEPWQEPVTLGHGTVTSLPPSIAIDSHGNAIAIWLASDGTNYFIQTSSKPFNGSWQATPDTIPGSQPASGDLPKIAVDLMGNATAVWGSQDGTDAVVKASSKRLGEAWQEIPDILPRSSPQNTMAQIAIDNTGNATVVWSAFNGSNYSIQAATKPFNGSWQNSPDTLSSSDLYSLHPQLAIDGSENVTVVWESQSGTEHFAVIQSATKSSGLTVTHVQPTSGPRKGKNTVTITGTNFVDVSAVYFGSTPASSFTVDSPTTITAVVPKGKGTVDVTVMTSSQTSPMTLADLYTYRRFKGKVKHHRNKLFVKTKWNKSAATVTGYEIFARKKKIATIPAQNKAHATIRLHPCHIHHEISNKYRHYLQHKYKVRAIDADGTAGAFTFLNVHR
jgi:hypothetical protein